MKHRALAALAFLTIFVIASCQTVPTEIPSDLSQAELIQSAQDSADQENWDAAIAYYEAVRERFADDQASSAIAGYEIAFIEYKRGNTEEATEGFEALVALYETEGAILPEWPLILSEKLLAEIQESDSAASD